MAHEDLRCLQDCDRRCLLAPGLRSHWTCEACRTIWRWIEEGYQSVFVGAAPATAEAVSYVFPAGQRGAASSTQGCILSMDLQAENPDEVRAAINTLLLASDRTWLWQGADSKAGERFSLLKPEPRQPSGKKATRDQEGS